MTAFRDMDDAALLTEFMQWDHKVKTATGWGAALMQAAKWRDACGSILAERGLMQGFEPCIRRASQTKVLGDPRIRVEVPTKEGGR